MSRKKEHTPPPPSLTETEMESQNLELASASLEEQAKKHLSPDTVMKLKKIAYYTGKVGLPLNEACMLVDVDFDKFQEQMKLQPLLAKVIHIKELEFKKDMLFVLSSKARSGDVSLAQWLLERKFPDEFGAKKNAASASGDDLVFEAIRFIRKNGDNTPLVNATAEGRSISTPFPSLHGPFYDPAIPSTKPLTQRIDDILASPVKSIEDAPDRGKTGP